MVTFFFIVVFLFVFLRMILKTLKHFLANSRFSQNTTGGSLRRNKPEAPSSIVQFLVQVLVRQTSDSSYVGTAMYCTLYSVDKIARYSSTCTCSVEYFNGVPRTGTGVGL